MCHHLGCNQTHPVPNPYPSPTQAYSPALSRTHTPTFTPSLGRLTRQPQLIFPVAQVLIREDIIRIRITRSARLHENDPKMETKDGNILQWSANICSGLIHTP